MKRVRTVDRPGSADTLSAERSGRAKVQSSRAKLEQSGADAVRPHVAAGAVRLEASNPATVNGRSVREPRSPRAATAILVSTGEHVVTTEKPATAEAPAAVDALDTTTPVDALDTTTPVDAVDTTTPVDAVERNGSAERAAGAERPTGVERSTATDRVRVVVDSSDPISSAGLVNHLRASTELQLLPDGDLAQADVLVMCVDSVTAEVMSRLRRAAMVPGLRSVLVTGHIRDDDVLSVVECRVVSVVPRRHATSERLVRAVVGATAGRASMPSDLLGSLLAQVERLQRESLAPLGLTPSGLAPRELDVLRLVADGFDTAEIATKLAYSERTVKNILYAVLSRLGVKNRSHAVAYAIRAGVI
ncbi:MAG: hypothetical protein JWN95_2729 [Frankiales bacterium]|nr:hypothetical protein [Frankiales bacterium]